MRTVAATAALALVTFVQPVAAQDGVDVCTYASAAGDNTLATRWNETALRAICLDRPRPTVVARALFILSAALRHLFPDQGDLFAARLAALGHARYARAPAADLGRAAAAAVIAARARDGANAAADFASPRPWSPANEAWETGDAIDPNRWQPLAVPTGTDGSSPAIDPRDPGSYAVQAFLTPHWGKVEPFALASGDALRPEPPPRHGSSAPYTDARGVTSTEHASWVAQTEEVVRLQADLTDRQKVIAEYWAGGPRSATPPGHWNLFAQMVSLRDGHDMADDLRLFFALNGAMLDPSIAAWDAKAAYDYVRPITAIRYHFAERTIDGWRGPDRGVGPIDGADWRPYQDPLFVTPPFAEYVSGHSTFSAAGAEVLRRWTGRDAFFDAGTVVGDIDGDGRREAMGTHRVPPGGSLFERTVPARAVTLRWATFTEAADEAGQSRLYGGIHFQDGDLRGRAMGRTVGAAALGRARKLWGPMEPSA